ncbi:hypothetical protein BDZ97DRAFT_888673 [Flammula alnicola]|nr:hypothetical protein BDZ97DRAFT_888673 [Flammula alnicola]
MHVPPRRPSMRIIVSRNIKALAIEVWRIKGAKMSKLVPHSPLPPLLYCFSTMKFCFWRFSNRKTQSSGSQSAPREADGRSVDIQDGYSSQDSDSDSQEEYSQDEEDSWRACKFEATSQTRRSAQTTAADSQIQGHSLINTINRTPIDNPCSPACSGPYEQFMTDTRGNVTTVKHHCSWGPNETIRVESPCTLDLHTEAGCPGYVEEDKVDEHGNTAVVSQLCGHEKCQRARQEIWKHFRNSQGPGVQRWS